MKINYLIFVFFMMIKISMLGAQEEITAILHNEIDSHSLHANVTQETHPALYYLIEQIAEKFFIPMPRYIKFFTAQQKEIFYNKYTCTGTTYTVFNNFESYIDIMGDLYLCYEVFIDSSCEEIISIIALALAEKSTNKQSKLLTTGISTLATTFASLCYFNNLKNFAFPLSHSYHRTKEEREDVVGRLLLIFGLPAIITHQLAKNYCQKQIDLEAAKLMDVKNISNAILQVKKVKEKYTQESYLSRIMTAFKVRIVLDALIYPFRSLTPEERIQHLQQI